MTKKISKIINASYDPTFIGDYPVYGCGGRMKYGFGSFLKENAGTIGSVAGMGLGALVGGPVGASIGSSIGGNIGGGVQQADAENQLLEQSQKELINRQLMNNIPAQPSYVPTFAMGGKMYQDGGELTPKSFMMSYVNSPKFKQRISNVPYLNPDKEILDRTNRLRDVDIIRQEGAPNLFRQAYNKYKDIPYSMTGSQYQAKDNNIVLDAEQAKKLGLPEDIIEAHELSHGSLGKKYLNVWDQGEFNKRMKPLSVENYRNVHDMKPDEHKADMDAFRYELKKAGIYDTGTEDFNKEHLDKLKKSFSKDRLLKNYSEDDLIWLMNNIAKGETSNSKVIAAYGGRISPSEITKGIREEMEHTASKKVSKKTAMDHLKEDPKYYTKLKKAGLADSYRGGGMISSYNKNILPITDRTTTFENGGLHSENGGIPIGQNSLVERDEYMFTTKSGDKYIFSNKF
jgi:hypothetical protein